MKKRVMVLMLGGMLLGTGYAFVAGGKHEVKKGSEGVEQGRNGIAIALLEGF